MRWRRFWPLVWRSTLGLERLRGDILKDQLDESRAALRLCRRECRDLQQQVTVLIRPRPPTTNDTGFDLEH